MKEILKQIKIVKDLKHKNISALVRHETEGQQMFCTNFTSLKLVFESYENNLQTQVLERWERVNMYNDKQLL